MNLETIKTEIKTLLSTASQTDILPIQTKAGAYNQTSTGGAYDCFILRFTNAGVRQWATYYGGNNNEYASDITLDLSDNVWITGRTSSTNLPTQNPYKASKGPDDSWEFDVMILKFNDNNARQWATYYGGNGNDYGSSINVDASGNILIASLNGSKNVIIKDENGNIANITTYDVYQSNGVIHVIDTVVLPK